MILIETRDLSKKYKGASRPAVDKLNLKIERGTVFGILGPNGAGKTTTLMMLCGLLRPDSGKFVIASDLIGQSVKTAIGYVPQDLALYPKLTGRDNLRFFGRIYKIDRASLRERMGELLEVTGLADRADDLVGTYSTGMKRRLNLAVGMLHRPAIVLMDEPTVGIDPQSRNRIYDTISKLKKDGVTILYTTHYMEEASRLCDRLAIIDNGTVLLEGAPAELVSLHGTATFNYEVVGADADGGTLKEFVENARQLSGVEEARLSGMLLVIAAKNTASRIEQLRSIEQRAQRTGIELRLKNVVEPNLESLFLDLTGRMLRDSFDVTF